MSGITCFLNSPTSTLISVTLGSYLANPPNYVGYISTAYFNAGGSVTALGSIGGITSFRGATIGSLHRGFDGGGGADHFNIDLLGSFGANFLTGVQIENGAGVISYFPVLYINTNIGYSHYYFDSTSWTSKWASTDNGETHTVRLLG